MLTSFDMLKSADDHCLLVNAEIYEEEIVAELVYMAERNLLSSTMKVVSENYVTFTIKIPDEYTNEYTPNVTMGDVRFERIHDGDI